MKYKVIIITVFIFGFVVGAIVVNFMTIPAIKSYREMLQMSYLHRQSAKAREAIKTNNKLKAIIHLSNQLNADPVNGDKLFDSSDEIMYKEFLSFILLPYFDNAMEEMVITKPETKNATMGLLHGKIAALLDDIGQVEEAEHHWTQAASLLNMSEVKAKESFNKLLDSYITIKE
jgi:hypothetical protein